MIEIANEGAKVLHNRCIEIGQKYHIPIITKSTFNNKQGTIVQDKIEDTRVKSIVKNDDIIYANITYENYSPELFSKIFTVLLKNQICANHFQNNSTHHTNISFIFNSSVLNKFQNLLETDLKSFEATYINVSRIAIVGHGIMNDDEILKQVMKIIEINGLEIYHLEINESKIAIVFSKKISNNILEQLHQVLIEKC